MPDSGEVWGPSSGGALRQGEILSGLTQVLVDPASIPTEEIGVVLRSHAFVLVLSQDCDCLFDFEARRAEGFAPGHHKELPSILIGPAFTEAEIRDRPQVKSDIWRRIRDNQDERFHLLPATPPELDAAAEGLPELVIDFKRCFSIATDEAYAREGLATDPLKRRCVLRSPVREAVSTRAFAFHARVAVPE